MNAAVPLPLAPIDMLTVAVAELSVDLDALSEKLALDVSVIQLKLNKILAEVNPGYYESPTKACTSPDAS